MPRITRSGINFGGDGSKTPEKNRNAVNCVLDSEADETDSEEDAPIQRPTLRGQPILKAVATRKKPTNPNSDGDPDYQPTTPNRRGRGRPKRKVGKSPSVVSPLSKRTKPQTPKRRTAAAQRASAFEENEEDFSDLELQLPAEDEMDPDSDNDQGVFGGDFEDSDDGFDELGSAEGYPNSGTMFFDDPDKEWEAMLDGTLPPIPALFDRNQVPRDPEVYDGKAFDKEGMYAKRDLLKWNIQPPDNPAQRDCTFGDFPTLSEYWKTKLDGNKDSESFLKAFLQEDLIGLIVTYTNRYADMDCQTRIQKYFEDPVGAEPKPWKPVDDIEVWGFFGALYYMGLEGLNGKDLGDIFGHDGRTAHLPLLKAFTRERFFDIFRYIRFHDRTVDTPENEKTNKRRKIQELLDKIFQNCQEVIIPSNTITVDESLLSYRGRSGTVQYLPDKPDKYGLKFFTACDAVTGAVVDAQYYVGRERDSPGTDKTVRVVLNVIQNFVNSGRCIVTDRFYTSCTLALALLEVGLDCVGTTAECRGGFPNVFNKMNLHKRARQEPKKKYDAWMKKKLDEWKKDKNFKNMTKARQKASLAEFRATPDVEFETASFQSVVKGQAERGMSVHVFCDDMTAIKYEPTAKKGVHMISTKHHAAKVSSINGKPEAVLFYNTKKFGVDLLDQLVKSFSTKRTCRRWPMRIFFWILDVAAHQAYVAYRLANPAVFQQKKKFCSFRRVFMNDLADKMMRPLQDRNMAKNTPRTIKVKLLEVALRSFIRKTTASDQLNYSATLSELKRDIGMITPKKCSNSSRSKRALLRIRCPQRLLLRIAPHRPGRCGILTRVESSAKWSKAANRKEKSVAISARGSLVRVIVATASASKKRLYATSASRNRFRITVRRHQLQMERRR